MKYIARHEHYVRLERDDVVDRALESARYVCLTLIDAVRRETLVLPETEVEIREMDEAHAQR